MLAPREADEYVLPTERRVIRLRQHWAVVVKDVFEAAVLVTLLVVAAEYLPHNVVLSNLTFYGALFVVLRFSYQIGLWWAERIVVTDKRIMLSQGFITSRIGMMPLSKVTDLTYERSVTGRALGYGTLVIESAGQIQALNRISYVPQPEEFYRAVSELVFGEKRQTRSNLLSRPKRR